MTQALALPGGLEAWEGMLRVHERLIRELDEEIERTHGISLAEYDVLVQLEAQSERRLRMADLANQVLLTRSGLTRLVDRLEQRGLVERVRCPSDARGMHAVLTDAGAERLEAARPVHLAGVRRLFLDRLTPEEAQQLAAMWRRVGG